MPNHAAMVTGLILDQPTCIRCIAIKSSMRVIDLDQAIGAIDRTLALHRIPDRCRVCGVADTVLSIDRSL